MIDGSSRSHMTENNRPDEAVAATEKRLWVKPTVEVLSLKDALGSGSKADDGAGGFTS